MECYDVAMSKWAPCPPLDFPISGRRSAVGDGGSYYLHPTQLFNKARAGFEFSLSYSSPTSIQFVTSLNLNPYKYLFSRWLPGPSSSLPCWLLWPMPSRLASLTTRTALWPDRPPYRYPAVGQSAIKVAVLSAVPLAVEAAAARSPAEALASSLPAGGRL